MSEMVERVARALCWKNGMNPDLTLGGDGVNYLWHEYEAQARAAIAAMEPEGTARRVTKAVLDGGMDCQPLADAIAVATRQAREEALEEAARAAEMQDRIGYEWVAGSLWDNLCKRTAQAIRARQLLDRGGHRHTERE